ncbi:prepilin-type N-terminal cleavage/methylation domain-containing protein [Methylomarinum vadi]|uniref:prepilin-type N-terminal cleavage/methylation domain-containing protein n=1 Tax=Methylomarinum vadi TaxID=438855 RepID=UPI0005653F18|nr:prepilin-type N-terminal cleavage/methylation domain-containing protein [Methylomarinum vadi]
MNFPQSSRGFTLIEVMLAMTLLSIMVVLLFASLRISSESWNAGETKVAQVNEKAVVYQFFKRQLTNVRPLWDDFSDSERHFSFQGERDWLQFVSLFPTSAGRKGLQLFEISPKKMEKDVIIVKLSPFYPTEENREWREEEEVLLEHVAEFRLEYFEPADDGGGRWVDNWRDRDNLPALVKIRIGLEDESYWPDMIFPLRLAAPTESALLNPDFPDMPDFEAQEGDR